MVMGRNGMGRNGYGPKWSWAEIVIGRNDPEPVRKLHDGYTNSLINLLPGLIVNMAVVDPGTVYLVFAGIILFVIGIVSIFCKDSGNSKLCTIFTGTKSSPQYERIFSL